MSLTPPVAVVAFVRQRVSALLGAPDAWGPPEAVELQLLLLLEMWHVAKGASQDAIDGVTERYNRHLSRAVPGPPVSLSARLELTTQATERFGKVLREFAELELALQHTEGVLRVAQAPRLPRRDRLGPCHLEV